MTTKSVQKIYDNYASYYDLLFGKFFNPGREDAVDIINEQLPFQAKVLEVGVGTGLSLPLYRGDLQVMGIDVSDEMLLKAKKRVQAYGLSDRISLFNMDAANLQFQDNSFDCIVAMYVVSVVPDLQQFLQEITRVCRAGGHVIVLNHFTSNNKILRSIEKKFTRAQKLVGFRSDCSMEHLLNHHHFQLIGCYKANALGYWKLLHFKKN